MCPEAIEKMKQMDSMEPAPTLTAHQFLHTVELAHNQTEENQAAVFLSAQTCCSFYPETHWKCHTQVVKFPNWSRWPEN